MEGFQIIGEQYVIQEKIGSGSFGNVYKGINVNLSQQVAIKCEKSDTPDLLKLTSEAEILTLLQGSLGIPSIYWNGEHDGTNFIVMELLGQSLHHFFKICHKDFTHKTVIILAYQMLQRIELVHQHNLIHRDLKPQNFVTGIDSNAEMIYLIDFGLAKRYRDTRYKHHIPYREGKGLIGNLRFASVHAHMGIEGSRRDDLESLGYI